MRIITYTTLYPNAARPGHGIFVETRLAQLVASGAVRSTVVAPVPWFPIGAPAFGDYARHARAPRREERAGLCVLHPRFPSVPKVGMTVAPFLLAAATLPAVRRVAAGDERCVLIDAHYFYPDGVAAVMLGARLSLPVVITARGTDLNLIPEHALPRRMIRWAAGRAAGLVTVSAALKERLVGLGVDPWRVEVLRNGVDCARFRPIDREAARRELGYARRTLLSVGNLVPLKGHDLVIRCLALVPGCDLVVAGEGPERSALEALARDTGVAGRVRFTGALDQDALARHYAAADALVLASSREGWANVLLEAMACGTPVVATRVGGNPEAVAAPEAGVLAGERTPEAIAAALRELHSRGIDRARTRRYAERFGWDETTRGQIALFRRILEKHK
ncbi:MAG: glycosyltransferase family 4 protein [Burkholderiales bacterium]|nr:glycosyltransferase family 4 protein [Burkholderiales bacterium]